MNCNKIESKLTAAVADPVQLLCVFNHKLKKNCRAQERDGQEYPSVAEAI